MSKRRISEMQRLWVVVLSVVLLAVLPGCSLVKAWVEIDSREVSGVEGDGQPEVVLGGGTVTDLASLLEALKAAGAEVEMGEALSQPFLDVEDQIIRVNGVDVQVFEFPNPAEAENAATQISPDGGSTGTTMITWIEPPHFYQSEQLIVLYVGQNPEIQSLLEALLGLQFAGR
jgi:hypothetical protein